jgi:hypothetical protein
VASLKEAAAVTEQLEELAARLHSELSEKRMDFGEMAALADQIGESADAMASAFMAIDEAVSQHLTEPRIDSGTREKTRGRGPQRTPARDQRKTEGDDSSSSAAEPSREELLERARKLEIAGRSTMSKEELAAAIESEEQVSKSELLDRAKEAGIAGRTTMSKEELAEAVRSEESLSREELLERAREADIPGRSEMSKEELREALGSQ